MQKLSLQLYNNAQWHDAAEVCFYDTDAAGRVTISYTHAYLANCPSYDAIDCWACSVNAPVTINPADFARWPALFDDLLPAGKSRQWWLNYLDASRDDEFTQNLKLLANACASPIGNLRIKTEKDSQEVNQSQRFSIKDVVQLQYDFLEYANEQGAAVCGATGAGGVAPKLLLMVEECAKAASKSSKRVYIDGDFAGKPLNAKPYLTKFARNECTERDNQILKAEGSYYRSLNDVLADTTIATIDVDNMLTLEHEGQVSLWLPRFDVEIKEGLAHRVGVESIYSMLDAAAGSYQDHFEVIESIWTKIQPSTRMSSDEFIKQYVSRDLLNLVYGNSDNHGRNISFLKRESDICFAPIYDFAPMKADPEMVTRLFKWGANCEMAGKVNFIDVAQHLDAFCKPRVLIDFLNSLANKLLDLPNSLKTHGCPIEIIEFPAIGFKNTEARLKQMGLLYD
ncbi:type II toxin-antitoxin system HipA family toxin [Ningiella sp. W23]|uniref:type II toxin-antitoxin system HipA family toxin n=1 Tax=Ningiella sp. W23 TaxID=3023715 RepID=UPI003756C708